MTITGHPEAIISVSAVARRLRDRVRREAIDRAFQLGIEEGRRLEKRARRSDLAFVLGRAAEKALRGHNRDIEIEAKLERERAARAARDQRSDA